MSFLSGLKDFGSKALGFLQSDSIGSNLAKTALLGFATYKLNQSLNKGNDAGKDSPSRVQVPVNSNNSIPIVYGSAYVKGIVTDAILSSDRKKMYFVLTISEKTGNLINGNASEFSFIEAYRDGLRIEFQSNGYSVQAVHSEDGDSLALDGLIKVYPFNGDSESPTTFATESVGNTSNAYDIIPIWTSTDQMNDLHFVIVEITYNAEKDIRSLGDWTFKVNNSMTLPGDVLFDYMTNTRYGAGIPEEELNKS